MEAVTRIESFVQVESFAQEILFRIGHQIDDLDVRRVTPDRTRKIHDPVYKHKLLIFKNQDLTNKEYIAFARTSGHAQIYFQKTITIWTIQKYSSPPTWQIHVGGTDHRQAGDP